MNNSMLAWMQLFSNEFLDIFDMVVQVVGGGSVLHRYNKQRKDRGDLMDPNISKDESNKRKKTKRS